jgi:hypothetical protein
MHARLGENNVHQAQGNPHPKQTKLAVHSKPVKSLQRIWQINTRKCYNANALLEIDAFKLPNKPIILITEPYCVEGQPAFTTKGYTVYAIRTKGLNPRAAIAILSYIQSFQQHSLSNRDTVTVTWDNNRTICLISAYLDIEITKPVVGQKIQNAVTQSEHSNWDLLIAADSYAHSKLWGSEKQNPRGCQVEDFLATNDLVLKNVGNAPTFVPSRYQTIIYITVVNRKLEDHIADWAVNGAESESDHKHIEYTLDFESTRTIESRNYRKANWVLFRALLARATKKLDPRPTWDGPRLDLEVERLVKAIDKALDKACPKKTITVGVNKSNNTLDWFQPDTFKLSKQVKQYALIYHDKSTDANRQR